MDHIDATRAQLEGIMAQHTRPVIWVSGGKDSLTLLHLLQPWPARVTILHNALDGGFPGVEENLAHCVEAWGFGPARVVQPMLTLDAYVAQYGWPVEVVPTSMDGVNPTPFYDGGVKVSSWWHCTETRQLLPILLGSYALQADAVLTGCRASDAPLFARMTAVNDYRDLIGWVRYDPLKAWSTAEIWAYVEAHQIPLPPHYAEKRHTTYEWPDCLACTWQPEHLRWLKTHHPDVSTDVWAKAGPTLHAVKQALQAYTARLEET